MHADTIAAARVYVGTYAKYNNGSISGAWLDCTDYADREEFMKAAKALHSDEADPELMFQDYEGFPREYYGESHIKDELWAWLELDEDDRTLLAAYQEGIDATADINAARDAYLGTADNEADYAAEFYEEHYSAELEKMPAMIRYHIDWHGVARDMRLSGDVTFTRYDGTLYVFANN